MAWEKQCFNSFALAFSSRISKFYCYDLQFSLVYSKLLLSLNHLHSKGPNSLGSDHECEGKSAKQSLNCKECRLYILHYLLGVNLSQPIFFRTAEMIKMRHYEVVHFVGRNAWSGLWLSRFTGRGDDDCILDTVSTLDKKCILILKE